MTAYPSVARLRAVGLAAFAAALVIGTTSASAYDAVSTQTAPVVVTDGEETRLSLNLLSEPRSGTRTVRTRSMGNGSYLCSLAGLGQRSRCRRN